MDNAYNVQCAIDISTNLCENGEKRIKLRSKQYTIVTEKRMQRTHKSTHNQTRGTILNSGKSRNVALRFFALLLDSFPPIFPNFILFLPIRTCSTTELVYEFAAGEVDFCRGLATPIFRRDLIDWVRLFLMQTISLLFYDWSHLAVTCLTLCSYNTPTPFS